MTDSPTEQDARPVRTCDVCGGRDDHPRHVVAQPDGSVQSAHMDCCRAAGCPDGSCDAVATDLRGGDLLAHITAGSN